MVGLRLMMTSGLQFSNVNLDKKSTVYVPDMYFALTSAWEISVVREEPILPFNTRPPPVIVPVMQEKNGINF